jgi:hypothetical protein
MTKKGNPAGAGTPGGAGNVSGSKHKHTTPDAAEQPAANALPRITSVLKPDKYADAWVIVLDGCRAITMSTAELHSNRRFNQACMRDLGRCFAPVGAVEWSKLVDDAMREGGAS